MKSQCDNNFLFGVVVFLIFFMVMGFVGTMERRDQEQLQHSVTQVDREALIGQMLKDADPAKRPGSLWVLPEGQEQRSHIEGGRYGR
mgnify:CR=1 FL=1